MSDSRNGSSPQASVQPGPRHSHLERPPMGEEGAKPRSKQGRRSVRLTVLFMVLIPLVAVGGAYYYARSQSYQSTDDAFIDGHIISVAPQVAGRVDRVLVTDNQVVKKGDLVVVLDDRNFTATSNQKAAALDNVRAQEGAAKASIEQALAHVNSLQATVESDQAAADASRAQAEKAAKDFQRTMELFRNRVVSAQDQDAARATQKAVEPGDYVQTGQILFALVPDSVWVTANYKEDQIGLMRSGQPVQIDIDALHGQTFRGHVDSIQSGSGARFSLLPPENATGNYVKVVQRVPVKIVFDPLRRWVALGAG